MEELYEKDLHDPDNHDGVINVFFLLDVGEKNNISDSNLKPS